LIDKTFVKDKALARRMSTTFRNSANYCVAVDFRKNTINPSYDLNRTSHGFDDTATGQE